MRPYNLKTWGYPLDQMDIGWMGERVAVPDVDRIRRQVAERRDDVSWGPNRTFRFPLEGGTGAIWTSVARMLPPERLTFNAEVTSIDAAARTIRLVDGRELPYDVLVTTTPLDRCCRALTSIDSDMDRAARTLRHSSVHIVGIGLRGPQPETLGRKCWMYFPETESPYYRVTVFSNYSPRNVPDGDDYWSLMAEICESPAKAVAADRLVDQVIDAMRRDGLIPAVGTAVVSRWHHREEYGYPTPFIGRDESLATIRESLERLGIFSRGRFGAWKYEVSNQDHSFMQGVELIDHLAFGRPQITIDSPDVANSGTFLKEDSRARGQD